MNRENQIKNLILRLLKNFDISQYEIQVCFYRDDCTIKLKKDNTNIYVGYCSEYDYLGISFDKELFNSMKYLGVRDYNGHCYERCNFEDFLNFLESESIKIMKELYFYKITLKSELRKIITIP